MPAGWEKELMKDGEHVISGAARLQKQIMRQAGPGLQREEGGWNSCRAERAGELSWGWAVGEIGVGAPVLQGGPAQCRPGWGAGRTRGRLTCPPRRPRRCGSPRWSAAPTCRWAARGSGRCSSARGTARRCRAPRTAARCVPSRPPAAPPACWGAAGGLQGGGTGEPTRGRFLQEGREVPWAQA